MIRTSLTALTLLTLLTVLPGCPESFLYSSHGIWLNIARNTSWNAGDGSTPTCDTTTNTVTLNKDGSYSWSNRFRELQDDANCGQPEEYTSTSTETGTFSFYTADADKRTWLHFRREHQTSSYAYGSQDPTESESGDTSEWSIPFADGRDDMGPFLLIGDAWDALLFRHPEE